MPDLMKDIGDTAKSDREDLKASLAARLGVDGDFIRVPQLARALGISATSIHAQMRRGIFPIFHRRVGGVILVKLDDYVDWFQCESYAIVADEPSNSLENEATLENLAPVGAELVMLSKVRRESRAEFNARINQEVIAGMRSKGFDV